jgi:hypothetical protein
MIRFPERKKNKPGDIYEILLVEIGIDPPLKNFKKRNDPDEKHPRERGRKSNQPYEIFPSLFYLLNNSTFMEVVERGAYG